MPTPPLRNGIVHLSSPRWTRMRHRDLKQRDAHLFHQPKIRVRPSTIPTRGPSLLRASTDSGAAEESIEEARLSVVGDPRPSRLRLLERRQNAVSVASDQLLSARFRPHPAGLLKVTVRVSALHPNSGSRAQASQGQILGAQPDIPEAKRQRRTKPDRQVRRLQETPLRVVTPCPPTWRSSISI